MAAVIFVLASIIMNLIPNVQRRVKKPTLKVNRTAFGAH